MQKKKAKNFYLFVSSLLIGLFSFPFAFAKTAEVKTKRILRSVVHSADYISGITPVVISVYDSLHLNITGLSKKAFDLAQEGLEKLKEQGEILNDSIISIIDFSLPSSEKRLYVLDLKNYRVLFNTMWLMEEIPARNSQSLFQINLHRIKAAWVFILPAIFIMEVMDYP